MPSVKISAGPIHRIALEILGYHGGSASGVKIAVRVQEPLILKKMCFKLLAQ